MSNNYKIESGVEITSYRTGKQKPKFFDLASKMRFGDSVLINDANPKERTKNAKLLFRTISDQPGAKAAMRTLDDGNIRVWKMTKDQAIGARRGKRESKQ